MCIYDICTPVVHILRGVCLTTVILDPGASEGLLGPAGQVALRADLRDPRDWRKNSGRPLFICRLRASQPFARNWTSNFAEKILHALRQTKPTSMATKAPQSGPRAAQRDTKRTQGRPKEGKGRSKDMQRRPRNQKIVHT